MKYFLSLAICVAALSGCSGGGAEATPTTQAEVDPAVEVRVANAEMRQVEKSILVTGSLAADEEVTLGPNQEGRLAVVHVDFGQPVHAGQVVAELDKREFELALERSNAALAQALARIGLNPDQADVVPDTTPAIRQATAQLENARSKFESADRLIKTGDIAQDRYVELEKAYNAAQAALDAAQDDLRTSLANIKALRAEVDLASKHLDDADLRAPFDGTIAERMASPGQFLPKNGPVVRIVKTWPMRVRLNVPEPAVQAVRDGVDVSFTTAGIPGETFHAVVREVADSLDAATRSLSAEARMAQPDSRLKPGMFVQVRVVVDPQAEVVVVPVDAIQTVAGLNKLFIIRDGKAVEMRLATIAPVDGWVEIEGSELAAGDQVAVSNLPQLVNGATVRTTGS